MNTEDIVNHLIKESLVNNGPDNITTPAGSHMGRPGGTETDMLAGELFGSEAWPMQMPKSNQLDGMNDTIIQQAATGLGAEPGVKPVLLRGVNEEVEALLEGELDESEESDTVEALLFSLREAGYDALADELAVFTEEIDSNRYNDLVEQLKQHEINEAEGEVEEMPENLRMGVCAMMEHVRDLILREDMEGGSVNDDDDMMSILSNPLPSSPSDK